MGKISKYYLVLILIIGLHLLLLSKIIFFPYPELFIYSYLTELGLVPYEQIFDQHFPGLMFFPINLFSLGIDTVYEFRILHLLLVVVNHVILYFVLFRITKSKKISLLGNLLYLIWQPYYEGYVLWIESFTAPLILLSFFFLIKEKKDLFISGLLLGFALLFKQVVSPLIGLIFMFLFFRNKKHILAYVVGVSLPVFLLVLFVLSKEIWNEFVYWTVTFNLTTFADLGTKRPQFINIFQIAGVFISALFVGILSLKHKLSDKNILMVIYLIGTLFFALARFDFVHLQPSLIFAIILLIYFAQQKGYRLYKFAIGFLLIISILIFLPRFYSIYQDDRVLFFTDFEHNISEEVSKYANEGDPIFVMGTTPHLYYLTETRPPGDVFVFQFPWFMIETEDEIMEGIRNEPPQVVVRDQTAVTSGLNLVSFMPQINEYIEANYYVEKNIKETEIMLPK